MKWSNRVPWHVSLLLMLVGVVGLVASINYFDALGARPGLGLCAGSGVVILVGLGTFIEGFRYLPWRYGRIVPVQVVSTASGPKDGPSGLPPIDALGAVLHLLLILIELLVGLWNFISRRKKRRPNLMTVQWLEAGVLRTAAVEADYLWGKWKSGEVCWLCIYPPFRNSLVLLTCPQRAQIPLPAPEVITRLNDELLRHVEMQPNERGAYEVYCRSERDRLQEEQEDLHQAAKAATRTPETKDRYNRRAE
ncbi:MAG: hypothetical protein KDB90_08255 [Planctomycetes bacterium]|nr:hypothetical protein [Planctomycetota bacterium]